MTRFFHEENLEDIGSESHILQHHLKRETPKINGSVGAFIAVVVCLIAVILVSCIGIAYLIRDDKIFDEEHGQRRRAMAYPSSQANLPRETSRNSNSIIARIFSLFHPRDDTPLKETNHTRAQSRGWMQAQSSDEWDFAPDHSIQPTSLNASLTVRSSRPTLPPPVSRSTSGGSVQLDINAIRRMGSERKSSPSHAVLLGLNTQASPISYSPATESSPIRVPISPVLSEVDAVHSAEIRQYSTPVGVMQTIRGGTKFVENL